MSAWTTGQNDVIRELGYRGAEAVREEIRRRSGIKTSMQLWGAYSWTRGME